MGLPHEAVLAEKVADIMRDAPCVFTEADFLPRPRPPKKSPEVKAIERKVRRKLRLMGIPRQKTVYRAR